MSNTAWILVGVAVAVLGVAAWLLMTPVHASQETSSSAENAEPDAVEPVAASDTASPEPEAMAQTSSQVETVSGVDVPRTTALWVVDGVIDLGEYRNHASISDVQIHWQNDANTLRMALESPGTGYVSIGLDPERRMEGANYIIGYVEEGVAHLRDDFGTGTTMHSGDTERGGRDNILSSAGSEWADHTVIEFAIPLDSGDEMDKVLQPGGTYDVIVAYHDLQDGFDTRHSRRGSGQITLDAAP